MLRLQFGQKQPYCRRAGEESTVGRVWEGHGAGAPRAAQPLAGPIAKRREATASCWPAELLVSQAGACYFTLLFGGLQSDFRKQSATQTRVEGPLGLQAGEGELGAGTADWQVRWVATSRQSSREATHHDLCDKELVGCRDPPAPPPARCSALAPASWRGLHGKKRGTRHCTQD